MAVEERIVIAVTETGARVVQREIENIGGKANSSAKSVDLLKRGLGLLAAAVSVQQIVQMTSAWTDLNSRLRLAAGSQEQASAVMERLQEIARRTYTDLNVTSEAYLRNAAALTEMGFSTKQQVDFSEALANALVVSGAKAERAASVTNALSKAIAGGALRGENLNTVLESGGRVAEALAQGLGVGVNELRRLGQEGKLTSDRVLPALNSQLEKLREEADSMPATIQDAFTNLRSQLMVTIGTLFDTSEAGSTLVGAIDWVRTTIETLTPTLVNITRALTGTLDPMDEMSTGAKVAATIFTILFSVLKTGAQLIWHTVIGTFKTLGGLIGGVASAIVQLVHGDFSGAWDTLKATTKDTATNVTDTFGVLADDLAGGTIEMMDKLVQVWDEGSRQIQDRSADVRQAIDDTRKPIQIPPISTKELEKLKDALKSLEDRYNSVWAAQNEYAEGLDVLARAQKEGLVTKERAAQIEELMRLQLADALDPLAALNREYDREIDLLRQTADEREISSQLRSVELDLLSAGIIMTDQELKQMEARLRLLQEETKMSQARDAILQSTLGTQEEFALQLQALNSLVADGTLTQAEANNYLVQSTNGMLDGTREAFDAYTQQYAEALAQIDRLRQADLINEQTAHALRARAYADNVAQQLKTADDFFGQLSQLQALEGTKMAKIGKAAAIAQATIKTYESATSAYAAMAGIPYVGPALGAAAAAAAIAAGLANVAAIRSQNTPGFATGGSFTVPGSGGVDSQMVAFRATPGEKVAVATPAQIRKGDPTGGAAAPPAPTLNQRIINVVDPAMVGDYMATPEGEQLVVNVIRRNREAVSSALNG